MATHNPTHKRGEFSPLALLVERLSDIERALRFNRPMPSADIRDALLAHLAAQAATLQNRRNGAAKARARKPMPQPHQESASDAG